MKKRYNLTDLDCANCAAKMETAIKKIDGVNDATVSFMAQKMTIDADDGQLRPHSHARCRLCGAVADLPAIEVGAPADDGGFLLEDCAVIYRGVCPDCRRAGKETG